MDENTCAVKEMAKAGVLTISDKGSVGERSDESGDIAAGMLVEAGFTNLKKEIVPDNIQQIVDRHNSFPDPEG